MPIAVAALFGFYRYLESQSDANKQVARTLRVVHENAEKVVDAADIAARSARALVDGRSPADIMADSAVLRNALADIAKDQAQIQSVIVFGPDGRLLLNSRTLAGMGNVSAQNREYFKFHQSGPAGQRFLSEPMVAQSSGERILALTIGFKGADGQFGGVVSVSVKAAYFEGLYSDLATGQPGLALAAFTDDGRIYARWPVVPGVERLDPRTPFMAELAGGRAAGLSRGVSPVDGQDRLMAYQRVGGYPFYVAAGISLTALRIALLKDLAVLVALGALPFAALWWTIRAATKGAEESIEARRLLDEETVNRKRAEDALAQSQRLEALGRVAGGVAHEFNNALMVIGSNVHLIRRSPPEAAPRRLDSIGRAVDAATRLTRQLLSFTRRQALDPVLLDLTDFLPATAPLLSPILGGRVALAILVDPGTLPIRVDSAELELALVNLTINARDAMPEGGSFTLHARPAGDGPGGPMVAIEAMDDGTGIAPEILGKVLDPFFTTKEVGQGTGLGLSQVNATCERAGGTATVHSAQGQGTTVTLLFPVAPPTGPVAAPVVAPDAAPLGKRILLAEDDEAVAEVTVGLLSEIGCEVTRVDRASAALAWIAASPAAPLDMVVTDVRMPGEMDGLGLAKWLRQTKPGLPVLLVTGYAESMAEIEREGFAALAKPFTADALRAALAKAA